MDVRRTVGVSWVVSQLPVVDIWVIGAWDGDVHIFRSSSGFRVRCGGERGVPDAETNVGAEVPLEGPLIRRRSAIVGLKERRGLFTKGIGSL